MFNKFFGRFLRDKKIDISSLKVGQLVELKYKHPKEMGFLHNSTTCTRLNEDELENRTIKGSITSIYKQPSICKWFIGIKSYKKSYGNSVEESYERHYLFIEDEIDYIRELS
jgi:hypothetical protein